MEKPTSTSYFDPLLERGKQLSALVNDTRGLQSAGPAGRFFFSALLAGLGLFLCEQLLVLLSGSRPFVSGAQAVRFAFFSASLLGVWLLPYAFFGGTLFGLVQEHLDPFTRLWDWFRISRLDARADRRHAASLVAFISAFGFLLASQFLVNVYLSSNYNAKALAGIVFTLGLLFLLGLSIVLYASLNHVLRRWFIKLPDVFDGGLTLLILLVVGGVALLGAGVMVRRSWATLELLNLKPLMVVGVFLVLQAIGLRLLHHPLLDDFTRYVTRPIHRVSLAASWVLLLALTIYNFNQDPHSAFVMRHYAPLSQLAVRAVQTLGDRDGDGYASILLGGDCNDRNPGINPTARDIPGNGVDEDCLAGDAAIPAAKRYDWLDEETQLRLASLRSEWNILLITIDALRADHTGFGGYDRPTTPELDQLAEESVVFERAYTQAPNTPQAIPALMSGRYPSEIDWSHYHNFPRVKDDTPLLHELFQKELGYQFTGVFGYWYFENRNLERGAKTWDNRVWDRNAHPESHVTANKITDNALEHLHALGNDPSNPQFFWLHYFDPHFLYNRHKGIRNFGERPMDRYDHEILGTDREVGRFLREFRQTKLWDHTVVVITADHGEEFGEHGGRFHGAHLYEEVAHVPLMIRIPGVTPRRVSKPVSSVDLASTLGQLCGLAPHADPTQGKSLLPLALNVEGYDHGPVFSEKLKLPAFPYTLRTFIDDNWKLVDRPDEMRFELYNLDVDPMEQDDLSDRLPERLARMKKQYADWKAEHLTGKADWYKLAAGM